MTGRWYPYRPDSKFKSETFVINREESCQWVECEPLAEEGAMEFAFPLIRATRCSLAHQICTKKPHTYTHRQVWCNYMNRGRCRAMEGRRLASRGLTEGHAATLGELLALGTLKAARWNIFLLNLIKFAQNFEVSVTWNTLHGLKTIWRLWEWLDYQITPKRLPPSRNSLSGPFHGLSWNFWDSECLKTTWNWPRTFATKPKSPFKAPKHSLSGQSSLPWPRFWLSRFWGVLKGPEDTKKPQESHPKASFSHPPLATPSHLHNLWIFYYKNALYVYLKSKKKII